MRHKTWLLDIDGVLNPVGIKPPTHVWKDWVEHKVTDPSSGSEARRPVQLAGLGGVAEADRGRQRAHRSLQGGEGMPAHRRH